MFEFCDQQKKRRNLMKRKKIVILFLKMIQMRERAKKRVVGNWKWLKRERKTKIQIQ